MYTMKCGGESFYSPFAAGEGYGVISPKINYELNRAGSLEFILPPDNVMYASMQKLKSMITVYKDGEEIFRGRVLHDEKDFYNRKHIYCEGELAFLMDSVVRPYSFSGSVAELFAQYLDGHNSQVEADKQFRLGIVDFVDTDVEEQYETEVFILLAEKPEDWETNFEAYCLKEGDTYYKIVASEAPEFEADTYYRRDTRQQTRLTKTQKENSEFSKTYDEIMNQLVEEFGGFLRIRHEAGVRYLDYVASYGKNSGQVIRCGENLLDLSEYITAEKLATCLIPLGAEQNGEKLTIAAVNGGVDYICSQSAINLFGKIWEVQQWNDITNAEKLKLKAEEYLQSSISMNVSITVSAIDLNLVDVQAERLKLGDGVRVVSPPHGLDSWFTCTKVELNLVEPDKSSYTFGYCFDAMTQRQIDEGKLLRKAIAGTKIIGSLAQETADKALSEASNARSYAVGSSRALNKKMVSLLASVDNLQAGVSAKVDEVDLKNALVNYVLVKTLEENYLTVNAAAELYATEDDVLAVIGTYIVTDQDGNKKSLAAILADQIQLQGLTDVNGSLNVYGGNIRAKYDIEALTGTVVAKTIAAYQNFLINGVEYAPQEITSTSGAVLALGYA